jgi:aryl-alcohol dehydrogenase-like predicted oxidoreductase
VGETFSGVDYETGLEAVDQIRHLLPENMTMAQFALRWILMFDAVTAAIPGAKNVQQSVDNTRASGFPPIPDKLMAQLAQIYDEKIKAQVHQRW